MEAVAAGLLAVHAGVAVAIVGGAFLCVRQDAIGFVDFLEARFRAGIALVAVGMVLHRLLAERRFERDLIDGALNLQHFV